MSWYYGPCEGLGVDAGQTQEVSLHTYRYEQEVEHYADSRWVFLYFQIYDSKDHASSELF